MTERKLPAAVEEAIANLCSTSMQGFDQRDFVRAVIESYGDQVRRESVATCVARLANHLRKVFDLNDTHDTSTSGRQEIRALRTAHQLLGLPFIDAQPSKEAM